MDPFLIFYILLFYILLYQQMENVKTEVFLYISRRSRRFPS